MRITSFGALLLAGTLAGRAPAAAQDLAGRWRTVPADGAALAEVYRETLRRGGDEVLRAVLATAADPARPPLARVHAVAALHAWVHPVSADLLGAFLWAARDAQVVCEEPRSWRPGETLRACTHTRTVLEHLGPSAAAPRAALTPAPARRDSRRAGRAALARGDPRQAGRGAADLLLDDLDPSLKSA
jgi:hypothetical protein